MKILGIDTSNYTTSVSIVSDGGYRHERQILEVAEGERGLRQSSALFLHTKNLPVLMEKLAPIGNIDAVAYSDNHMQAISSSHLTPEDVAIGISHSGSSKDIVDALKIAKDNGIDLSKYAE